ncbi:MULTISPECIES: ABC transporter permease [unclassified Duganella]|uniref:ABC transporter permease n=1 Tax=unclassified Duganella TaxID=2636909 RepID=UPI00088E5490|nr:MULTISPECIES: ABC transporter permease [unclassified Duganella]SDG78692.1 sulfonate transport system permease protein [Duganella sp. OV458]SDK05705.1 sulfonate transport system permease protein [Duganella sp. OV510]
MGSQLAAQSSSALPGANDVASGEVAARDSARAHDLARTTRAPGELLVRDGDAEHGATRAAAAGQRWRRALLGLLLPVTALLAVEFSVRAGLIPANLLPAPLQIIDTLHDLGAQGLLGHIGASTARVAVGFAGGAALAVLLGAAVGLSRHAEAILDPTFQALRAIPSLAWVPLLLLWLGIDEAPKIVLIAIGAFFPVYMGVASGIRGADRKLIEVARLYRLSNVALTRRVLLPAALPAILTGLRNGLSLAWMFMVAAELIAASKGLGYLLSDGRETSRADIVLAAIALLAILGKISDSLMAAIEQRSLAWRDSYA